MKTYDTEVRERWGGTAAYREYKEKTSCRSKEDSTKINDRLMAVFAEFAECKKGGVNPASDEAQALVAKLQTYITDNYYTCSAVVLAGLGKMYVADERFKNNIDGCGIGTAEFAAEAIAEYCKGTEGI